MGFKYRQCIGELFFVANTCCPEIFCVIIKLSQYASKHAKVHNQAVKHVFKCLCKKVILALVRCNVKFGGLLTRSDIKANNEETAKLLVGY